MSDEPLDAQKVIIQILEGIFATWIDRDGVKQVLVDGDYDGITGRPIADVAAEVDKALGGLKLLSGCNMSTKWLDGTRFVSGWTVTE